MGRDPQETPDLFSTDTVRDAFSSATKPAAAEPIADTSTQLDVLPKNLRHAVAQLSDEELDELCEVAVDEAKRRRRLRWSTGAESTPSSRRPSGSMAKRARSIDKTPRRRQANIAEVSLTRGQVNAVRAAFKAGITPSRIARQFGISQANVRKALASDESTR
jgi:transposase-like protein